MIGRKGDAQALDVELKRAKRLGAVAPIDTSRETVTDFAHTWWNRYVVPNLARHTQLAYASMLDVHILPALGETRVRSVTPELVAQLRAEMAAVAPPAERLRVSGKCPFCVRVLRRNLEPETKPLHIASGRSRTRTWDLFLIREAL